MYFFTDGFAVFLFFEVIGMPVGTVKLFDKKKGFGFISPESGDKDVFVHHSAIQGPGFKVLKQGQKVQYECSETSKGLQATKVEAID